MQANKLPQESHSTYTVAGLLVGALVQQQAHHLQVTIVGCNVERGFTILQGRVWGW